VTLAMKSQKNAVLSTNSRGWTNTLGKFNILVVKAMTI